MKLKQMAAYALALFLGATSAFGGGKFSLI